MEVVGWRNWRLCDGKLRGMARGYEWVPGTNTAQCWSGIDRYMRAFNPNGCDVSPGWDCPRVPTGMTARGCGFYAWWATPMFMSQEFGDVRGLVVGWGRLVEHEHGFRAQYARVGALSLRVNGPDSAERLQAVANRFRVPVVDAKVLKDLDFASEFGEVA